MELKFQINHIRFTVLTTAASLLILHIWMEEMKLLLPSKNVYYVKFLPYLWLWLIIYLDKFYK